MTSNSSAFTKRDRYSAPASPQTAPTSAAPPASASTVRTTRKLPRAERDADANLARPLHDRIAQDAVQPDGGQHQADQREEPGEQGEQPLAQERPIDDRGLRRDGRHAEQWIRGADLFTQPRRERRGISGHAHVKGAG